MRNLSWAYTKGKVSIDTWAGKYCKENLDVRHFIANFASKSKFGPWCNGNTTGFGSVIMGSSPVGPTIIIYASFFDWMRAEMFSSIFFC